MELGRVNIITEVEVCMLASELALPQEVHLEGVFQIFGYLKGHNNAWITFDPTYPNPDVSIFQKHDWCNFYGDVKKTIPPNFLAPWLSCVGRNCLLHITIRIAPIMLLKD